MGRSKRGRIYWMKNPRFDFRTPGNARQSGKKRTIFRYNQTSPQKFSYDLKNLFWWNYSDLTRPHTTSHDLTPNGGGLVREITGYFRGFPRSSGEILFYLARSITQAALSAKRKSNDRRVFRCRLGLPRLLTAFSCCSLGGVLGRVGKGQPGSLTSWNSKMASLNLIKHIHVL